MIIGCPTVEAGATTTGEVGAATTSEVDAEGEVDVEGGAGAKVATGETNSKDRVGWGWSGVSGDTESVEKSEPTTEGSKGEHGVSSQRPQARNGEEHAGTNEIVGVTGVHEGSSNKDVKVNIFVGVPDVVSENEKHRSSNMACRVI